MDEEIRRYFSSGEVLKLTDVTYRRLDTWVRRGIIHPSGPTGGGARRRRLFTFSDILEVKTLKQLTACGVRLGELRQCVVQLRRKYGEEGAHALASTRLVTNGRTVFRYLPATDQLESLDQYGQFAFAFGIGEEIASLREKVMRLERWSRYTPRRSHKQTPDPGIDFVRNSGVTRRAKRVNR